MERKLEKDTKFDWPKEAVLQLIELWRENECLYNTKHKFYHNKHARHAALSEIADRIKIFHSAIGPTDVKNKITYLRGQYCRETVMAKERKSGVGAEEIYVPSDFWFEEMGFLEEFVKIRKGSCNLYDQNFEYYDSITDIEASVDLPHKKAKLSIDSPTSSVMSQEDTILSAATSALQSITVNKRKGFEKYSAFCEYLMTELVELKNAKIRNAFMEKVTLALLDAKNQQTTLDETLECSLFGI